MRDSSTILDVGNSRLTMRSEYDFVKMARLSADDDKGGLLLGVSFHRSAQGEMHDLPLRFLDFEVKGNSKQKQGIQFPRALL